MRLHYGLVKYGQLSIEGVQLDWLAHTLVRNLVNADKVRKKTFVFCDV